MAENYVGGMPGRKAERTAEPRKVLACGQGALALPGGKVVDGSKSRDPLNAGDADVLRAGLLVGKIAASGKYAPGIVGVLAEAYDADGQTNTTLVVSAATATEIARRIGAAGAFKVTGPPTPGGQVATETVTFTAVDPATGEVTIEAADNDFIAGSFVQPADGSETPRGLIADGYGLKVTDADGSSIDVPLADLLIAGVVDAGQIVNYPSDASLKAQVKSWLRAGGYAWSFDDDF